MLDTTSGQVTLVTATKAKAIFAKFDMVRGKVSSEEIGVEGDAAKEAHGSGFRFPPERVPAIPLDPPKTKE